MEYSANDFRYYSSLSHYGILGMKWGVRRYQNKDGSLTKEGRTRYGVQQLEKEARKEAYKQHRKEGGHTLFPSARISTGKNFEEAEDAFRKKLLNDPKRKELSLKAAKAELKRLSMEKGINPYNNEEAYEKLINSEEYKKLVKESMKAAKEKRDYISNQAKKYIDVIKDAKIKDLRIHDKDKEFVRQYISDKFDDFVYDEKNDEFEFEYNDSNMYYDLDPKLIAKINRR